MLVVDSQIHIWTNGIPTNPSHRQTSIYSKDEALREMAEGGVDAAVIHPPGWDAKANELAVEAARQHPNKFAILGNFPLDRPESRTLLDGWKQRPGMLGLRFTFNQPHQRTWPTDGTLDWLWPAAERAGVPIGAGRGEFSAGGRTGRGTPSRAAAARRSFGALGRQQGRGGLCQPAGTPGAGQVSQRGR